MNIVLLGATRGMGRTLARMLAARGDCLFLLGRDLDELQRTAADLEVRTENSVAGTSPCDLARPTEMGNALTAALEALERIDAVVVTAAIFATQEELESSRERTRELLTIDFANTVVFCEHAREMLLAGGGGTLCVFSSVAGERGRSPVVLYGAAKAGLTAYLEGLDHRFHREGLRVVTVKPAFIRTSMTAGLREPPFTGDPEPVARRVMRALDRPTPVVYAPWIWRWVMTLVRWLPRWIMRRADF